MKKFRFVLPLLAVLLVVAASAFRVAQKPQAKNVSHWYQFTGDPTELSQVLNESNYVFATTPAGCGSNQYICAIEVPGDDSPNANPDTFDATIEEDLERAFNRSGQAAYIDMKLQP